jgi:hypothetical protein
MGLLQDLLKEVPLSSVLKERVALAEEKYESAVKEIEGYKQRIAALERENENLRAQVPKSGDAVSEDTVRVLVHLFKTAPTEARDVGAMSKELALNDGLLTYHLERLEGLGLAKLTGRNYLEDHVYWGITPDGRRYVVEKKLI